MDEWATGKPSSHATVAIVLVTYNVRSQDNLEKAIKWLRHAKAQLSELVTFVVVGVTDVGASLGRVEVSKSAGRQAALSTGAKQFYEAACGSTAGLHDVLLSATRQWLADEVQQRQDQRVRDQKLKAIHDELAQDGFITKIDPEKLAAAISAAERPPAVDPRHLVAPRQKLDSLLRPPPASGSVVNSVSGAVSGVVSSTAGAVSGVVSGTVSGTVGTVNTVGNVVGGALSYTAGALATPFQSANPATAPRLPAPIRGSRWVNDGGGTLTIFEESHEPGARGSAEWAATLSSSRFGVLNMSRDQGGDPSQGQFALRTTKFGRHIFTWDGDATLSEAPADAWDRMTGRQPIQWKRTPADQPNLS